MKNTNTVICKICVDKMDGEMCGVSGWRECVYKLVAEIERLEMLGNSDPVVVAYIQKLEAIRNKAKFVAPKMWQFVLSFTSESDIFIPEGLREGLKQLQQALEAYEEKK